MNDAIKTDAADRLVVVINGDPVLEYDRDRALPEHQLAYLDKMDAQMDAGVTLGGKQIQAPEALQRAQFVAVHLIEALQQDNEAQAAAACAYLATRMTDLKQVKAELDDAGLHVDLIFDRIYSKEVRVELGMPSLNRKH